jgi:dihydroorotate dehydrogenase
MTLYARVARPLLFSIEAERAHEATLSLLKRWPAGVSRGHDPKLAVDAFGLRFPNPLGLAAGFDKGGEAVDPLLRLGFGFVEVGTVTPLPQPGNPKPRLFRLTRDFGVVNRLGFNSEGHARVLRRLQRRVSRPGIVGVNLGANKESADRIADYVRGVEALASVAHYFTINISSPNTPGLRDLQQARFLPDLLARALDARERAGRRRPILLKISPDLSDTELDSVVRTARDAGVDGMIVANTTIARPLTLKERALADEAGGLSGRPLFDPSTRLLAAAFLRVEGAFPLVGGGGVKNPTTALAKIEAGATLLQLYSSMAFHGPSLPRRILAGLSARLGQERALDLVGRRARAIADGKAPVDA